MNDDLLRLLARTKDGRNVDPALGTLSGEGAQIEVRRPPAEAFPAERKVAREMPSVLLDATAPSYYGLPMLKEHVWTWMIPAYFFVGGASGASSLLATTLELRRGPGWRRLGRRARWLGVIGTAISGGLLVVDLGRPTRFLNMLRVFRPSSPMNMGTWILSAAGASDGAAALFGGRRGILGAVGAIGRVVSGLVGMPLAGYTAVLLSTTAVPVWQQSRKTLPLLFMFSGMASAASLLELLPVEPHEADVLRRYAIAGKVGALAATAAVHREAGRVPRVARPLRRGASGMLLTVGTALTAASLVASLWPGRSRNRRLLSGIGGVLGSLAMRFAIVHAGTASARDPYASFEQQRAGLGAAEVTGPSAALRGAAD
jgi:formate-dependent nitrite reductase membrane component NrfD